MIKGLWKNPMRLADGRRRWYVYAWRGKGAPLLGTIDAEEFPRTLPDEFIQRYAEATTRRPAKDTFEELVVDYLGSPEWAKLAASTQAEWRRHIEKLRAKFADGPLRAFEDRRLKRQILAHRDSLAATPRTADMRMQVLHRLLSWGVSRGRLAINLADDIGTLYQVDRAHIIIETQELAKFQAERPKEHGDALALACHTGLRRGDLVTLKWSEVDDLAIRRRTGKSRGKREAIIPLTDEARALLASIPRRSVFVLTYPRLDHQRKEDGSVEVSVVGVPWQPDSLTQAIRRGFESLGLDKHLHDARGTFATMLARAGFDDRAIAEAMGWAEQDVRAIRRKYVDGAAIILSAMERLRNTNCQTAVKRDEVSDE